MAARCCFGVLTNELVRDKLVGGMIDSKLRATLHRNTELTLDQAIHSCRISEITAPHADPVSFNPQQQHNVNLTDYSSYKASIVPVRIVTVFMRMVASSA